jgi:hypothetical protein
LPLQALDDGSTNYDMFLECHLNCRRAAVDRLRSASAAKARRGVRNNSARDPELQELPPLERKDTRKLHCQSAITRKTHQSPQKLRPQTAPAKSEAVIEKTQPLPQFTALSIDSSDDEYEESLSGYRRASCMLSAK